MKTSKINLRFIFYLFGIAFLKISVFLIIGFALLEIGDTQYPPYSERLAETVLLIFGGAFVLGLISALGTVALFKITSQSYDGTWKEFRKKGKFF